MPAIATALSECASTPSSFREFVDDSGQGPVILHGLSWETYEKLDTLLEGSGARLKFLENMLETMAPRSIRHEFQKGVLGSFVETCCRVHGIRYSTHENATLTAGAKDAGGEPDECFCLHENKETPDLVIEVALTSGGIDKLAFYAKFAVSEVWIWQDKALHVFHYQAQQGSYEKSEHSQVLAALNLQTLIECAQMEYTSDAVDAFEQKLRGA
jgi:Uma2 family endonuclease